jgi:hypothetical protein
MENHDIITNPMISASECSYCDETAHHRCENCGEVYCDTCWEVIGKCWRGMLVCEQCKGDLTMDKGPDPEDF